MDLGISGTREELSKKVIEMVIELIADAEDVAVEKENFRKFSSYVAQLKTLLQELSGKRVEAALDDGLTRTALQMLESHVRKAGNLVKSYKSGSRLHLLLNCSSVLSQLQQSAKEIADTISLLAIANIDATLELKSMAEHVIGSLQSLELRSAAATEATVSEIEKSVVQNGRSREHTTKLLQQIAEAVGASPNSALVRNEISLLKQEKQEMEAQKKRAEALQLSQLIHLLYSSEMIPCPCDVRSLTSSQSLISSFTCPLCDELMEDAVAIFCGHSFERKAILEHFGRGERSCPTCKVELSSLDLTPNISLQSSIREWKQRNMDQKLRSALCGLTHSDPNVINQALHDLEALIMDTPCYRAEITRQGFAPKIANLLKANGVDVKAALRCVCRLANYSLGNKEAIAEAGAIRCIIKQFCRGETEPEAVEVLLELSEEELLAEKIGNTKNCIPSLVSLLHNPNPDIPQKAEKVLQNLSSNTHFVIKMAEAGHFEPFIACFNRGHSETKGLMATDLERMQLNTKSAEKFENEQFVSALTKMLYSSSPASKSACIRCIKKLSAYHGVLGRFLADRVLVPALLGIMYSISNEHYLKQEAAEILISLVGASQASDSETNPSLRELQSEHNIHVFLQLATTSIPRTKISVLRLLVVIAQKSDTARNLIRSDKSTTACLFSSLDGAHHLEVRPHVLKLIYCIGEDHPDGIPVPPSPTKESIISALVTILTSSLNVEERATAAGIIGRLPVNDTAIDEMLCKFKAPKAIRDVICGVDNGFSEGMTTEPLPANHSDSDSLLLENALTALLRFTEPNKPKLRRQLSKLEIYPSLIRVLSTGSSLTKQRTALALAHLSQSTHLTDRDSDIEVDRSNNFLPQLRLTRLLQSVSWCCTYSPVLHQAHCSIHGSACSSSQTFCLIKAGAVRPLVRALAETECGASEAALMALDTLLKDDCTLSLAAAAIVENQGVAALLEVLERGSLSAKDKALDLFQKIFEHSEITQAQSQRSRRILIHLLQEDALKKKAALVLSQMEFIPQQSSYF